MSSEGFTRMFERLLDHPNIDVLLGVDYEEARVAHPHRHLMLTGPIDEYFGYRFGKLPYRSLRFRHENVGREKFQDVAVANYPAEDVPYTRITEYKHLTSPTNIQLPRATHNTRSRGPRTKLFSSATKRSRWRNQRDFRRAARDLSILQY
jgi:UDP-galactopyranose mutase